MPNDRLREKSELHFKLGKLLGPLMRLIEHPDRYDEQDRAETLARYFGEYNMLQRDFERFSKGQADHNYAVEFLKFCSALDSIQSNLYHDRPLPEIVLKAKETAQAAIDAIPVPRTSIILEAGSPFAAYLKLHALCEADTSKSITWLDPYMEASIFLRYLGDVRANVPITLVTSEPGATAGRRDRDRWTGFTDVSRLFASERGPALYRLVVQPQLHDRWVVVDNRRIYSLGGSAKDAGSKDDFTIASVESSPENLQRIQSLIDTGEEWFGSAVATHR